MIKIHNGGDYNVAFDKFIVIEIDDNDVTAVTGVTSSASAVAGGSLADDTYYYAVSAILPSGETAVGSEVNATTSGSNNSVKITITPKTYSSKYRIYKGIATGVYNTYFETDSLIFVDNGIRDFAFGTPVVTETAVDSIGTIAKSEVISVTGTYIPATSQSREVAVVNIYTSDDCKQSFELSEISNQATWVTTEAGVQVAVADILTWI